ncbi:hypothetical protein [Bryocella elongata]|uniref:hypothetical protein n=1 Tax=Bryocella elongata TaxID=863522 RepID=UPI000CDEA40A|nr:hypothetical protein [Bryocella elongata]
MKKFAMKSALFAVIPAVALSLGVTRAHAAPAPHALYAEGAGQDRPWDAPPAEFDDMNRRAFHDGIDAAQSDFLSGRRMEPGGSPAFKHPPVPKELRDAYRAAFARGYEAARLRSVYMKEHPGSGWDHDHAHWRQ